MTERTNPFLEQEDYFEGYAKKMEELKTRPDLVELDKLCYLVFKSEDGKKLLNVIQDRYLLPGFINPNNANAAQAGLYYEGFKEAFRMIIGSVRAHQQRIDAESQKQ